ncbi:hypothetical protein N186_09450 [Thermofilum adornatum]|uniref:Uncharacterized protein n=1 Tax=Thermofilum adornatum TaxID=1365176 RepID=S5ZA28_9CREN|nr:hypothetical protein N186_09450 [Thermofilum adornatum]
MSYVSELFVEIPYPMDGLFGRKHERKKRF